MATAKITTRVTTPEIDLHLASDEVEVLCALLGQVGGAGSSRAVTDRILDALAETLGFDAERGSTYPGPKTPDQVFRGTLLAL